MKLDRLDKLMIDATGFGYYQADDADPNDAVTPYAKARAREDALLEALKDLLLLDSERVNPGDNGIVGVDAAYRASTISETARDVIRQIEETR